MEYNYDLCWIAKVRVEIELNRLKNVLTYHKLIEELSTVSSKCSLENVFTRQKLIKYLSI